MRKTCATCKRRLVLSRFSYRWGNPLRDCKACVAAYGREWRKRNPEYKRPGEEATNDRYLSLKRNPCQDCGRSFPAVCMDYDHRPGEVKIKSVSRMVMEHRPWLLIEAEIAKCDLVCANCHRIRTSRRLTQGGTNT